MQEKYHKFNSNVFTVTNGFDAELTEATIELETKFTLTHIGMMNTDRNPQMLWEVLSEIVNENAEFASDFELKLIGKVDSTVIDHISKNNLSEKVQIINYVSHGKVVEFQKKSQVLLLIVNNVPNAKGIVTGKIFEYLMAKRPILAIAPTNGDLAEILTETNAGFVVEFDDSITLKKTILDLYSEFKKGDLKVSSKNIEQFHRKGLTKKVAEVIKEIIK